jgi:two-component system, response regulator PdtaR
MLETVVNPTVLLVDDEILIRIMIADELRDLGLAVIECGDADEALQVLQSGTPVSLVFTDVKMPGTMDGAGLANAIKREFPSVTVILTSAEVLPAGTHCDHFFAKPWDVPHVMRQIKSIVGD